MEKCQPHVYDVSTDKDLDMFTPFYNQVQGDEWALFDLKPLREAIGEGKLKSTPISVDLSRHLMSWLSSDIQPGIDS